MTGYPTVYIVVLNWNGVKDTIECIDTVMQISYPNYNIVVVDNGSVENDVEILREKYQDQIHVIANETNYGYPEGNNVGMRYALSHGADYVLILNNDTVVDRNFLTVLVDACQSDPLIGVAGSKIYYYHEPDIIQSAGGVIRWWCGEIEVFGEEEKDNGQYNNIAERDFVHGMCIIMKKEVINSSGYMDPYYFMGPIELDVCTRVKRAGYKIIYVPDSMVWHKAGASRARLSAFPSTHQLIDRYSGFHYTKYYYRFFKTYCPPILFIFPFLCYTFINIRLFKVLVKMARQGNWGRINARISRRLKLIFKRS